MWSFGSIKSVDWLHQLEKWYNDTIGTIIQIDLNGRIDPMDSVDPLKLHYI